MPNGSIEHIIEITKIHLEAKLKLSALIFKASDYTAFSPCREFLQVYATWCQFWSLCMTTSGINCAECMFISLKDCSKDPCGTFWEVLAISKNTISDWFIFLSKYWLQPLVAQFLEKKKLRWKSNSRFFNLNPNCSSKKVLFKNPLDLNNVCN